MSSNSRIAASAVPILTLEEVAYRVLPRVEPGRALADCEWKTLVKVAEVLLEGSPLRLPPEQAADGVERFLINGRSRRVFRCRALLTLVEYSTLTTHRRPFSSLSQGERRLLVEQRYVGGAGLWGLCAKVRYLVLMGAYGHKDAAEPTGFAPLEARARFRYRDSFVSLVQAVRPRTSVPEVRTHNGSDAAARPSPMERTVA